LLLKSKNGRSCAALLSYAISVLQATQTLYMLDFVGPAGFAQAAAELGAR